MKSTAVLALLAQLSGSAALPENIPGARLLPPGSHGERGGTAGGVSAAEQFAINDKLTCSGDMFVASHFSIFSQGTHVPSSQ